MIKGQARRTYDRGQQVELKVSFFKDAGATQPVVPKDATEFPAYTIYDINNQDVQSGVGQVEGSPGTWKAVWSIPDDAPLSNDLERWRIEWYMVSDELRQYDFVEEFDIKDYVVTASESREQKFINLFGDDHRTFIRQGSEPAEIQFSLFRQGQPTAILSGISYPGDIKRAEDGDSLVYYYDIESSNFLNNTKYNMIWKTRGTLFEPFQTMYQTLFIIGGDSLGLVTSVRMLIDKLQKRLGTVQSYEDSDIVEYLEMAYQLLNGFGPPSSYKFGDLPDNLTIYIILFAGWYALQAQSILNIELGFNFCVDEDTLISTDRGLVRACELVRKENLIKTLASNSLDFDLLETVVNCGLKKARSSEIAKATGLPTLSISSVLGRLGLESETSCGFKVWDIKKIKQVVDNFGDQFVSPDSYKLKTGDGLYLKPDFNYSLKSKPCIRVENSLGYPLIGTYNHPILVLNQETMAVEWKTLESIELGDLVAIDNFGEGDDIGSNDVSHLANVVNKTTIANTKHDIDLPAVLTPELCRILGYLLSEGDVCDKDCVTFFNTNPNLLNDFKACIEKVFVGCNYSVEVKDNKVGYSSDSEDKKPVTRIRLYGRKIRKFLYALGLDYTDAKNKKIPSSILSAKKYVVKEFIKAFIEGDGCISVRNKPYKNSFVIVCSHSDQLLTDFQNLFLRFGIVSKLDLKRHKLLVRGPSLRRYVENVGLLFKGDGLELAEYRTQIEAIPEILKFIKNIKKPLGLNRGHRRIDGKTSKQYSVGWNGNRGTKNVTWKHVEKWFDKAEGQIKELNPEVHGNLEFLLNTKYLWKPITKKEFVGDRDVVDPSFVAELNELPHSFIAGGIVNHNSGQTVTLDFDQSAIADVAGRWMEFVNNTLQQAKLSTVRRESGVGAAGVRAYRYQGLSNYVYKISSGNRGSNVLSTLTNLGLLY